MRLHRFFARNLSESDVNGGTSELKEIEEGSVVTYAHDLVQWQRVFRYGQGDRVILFDGSGKDYVCEIQSFQGEIKDGTTRIASGDSLAKLRVLEVRQNNVKPARRVTLAVALVKKDTFEWIVEKATELGVAEIIPVLAERSEKKSVNATRLEKISIEAAEQSGRGDVPIVRGVMRIPEVVMGAGVKAGAANKTNTAIVFDPSGRKFTDKDFSSEKITVFIGPEGGWSPEELEIFKKAGMPILSLGPQVLRTETAVVAAMVRVVF